MSPSRVAGALMVLVGVGAAVLLRGSDDPLRWALFYGLGALCGALALLGRLWWRHAMGYAALALGVGVVFLVSARNNLLSSGLSDETARLGLGAVLAGGLAAVLAWLRRREAPSQPNPYRPDAD